jgi:hypothetical protein
VSTLTLEAFGVRGESSFTMEDVLVVSVLVMVCLRMVMVASEDVPTWKCADVDQLECLHSMVLP